MGFSTCLMVVNDVHFHLFLISSWLIVINFRKVKTIVILCGLRFEKAWFWSSWSKWSKSQPHLQRMFWICFVLFCFDLIWGLWKRRNVERDLRSARSQQLVKLEKERKEKCDFSHLSNWMKLPRYWIGWMVETSCNQTNNGNSTKQNKRFRQRQNSIFFFFFQRVREMRFSLVLIPPFFRHFSNDIFESRSI